MKKALRFLLLALLVSVMFQSAKPASAQWFVGVHVGFGPPALPVYDLPDCPGPDYLWTPGYWAWDADDGYYWVPGTWVLAPEPGFLWTPGWWGWGDGGYFWHEGYWGPHVGFYGGINYGFGYWGDGFWGGRWQGGHFFYNTAVIRVGGGFHNVYRDETVIHNTTIINNHVSYNGGQGGIDRHPTPQEESFANERHVSPVADQNRQVESARGNPQLRASVNQGRPAIAATARAGEFSGHNVVQAREAGGEYHAPPARGARPEERAAPGGEGVHAANGNPAHASDLEQHQPAHVESSGNSDQDKKYQEQQQKLADKQNQEHQQLQQRQEQEHQQAQQQHYNQQKQQKMEQQHQQQTQKLEQQHQQQTQRLTQRQSSSRPKR